MASENGMDYYSLLTDPWQKDEELREGARGGDGALQGSVCVVRYYDMR